MTPSVAAPGDTDLSDAIGNHFATRCKYYPDTRCVLQRALICPQRVVICSTL